MKAFTRITGIPGLSEQGSVCAPEASPAQIADMRTHGAGRGGERVEEERLQMLPHTTQECLHAKMSSQRGYAKHSGCCMVHTSICWLHRCMCTSAGLGG